MPIPHPAVIEARRKRMYEDKYCRECGKELNREETGFYSPETGEPVTIGVCENRCHTFGCDFSLWELIIPIPYNPKCRRCGKKHH